MTATETALDLGQLAIMAEGYAPADTPLSVEITAIADFNAEPGAPGWCIEVAGTQVVIVALGDAPTPAAEGVVAHLADQLGGAATDVVGASRPGPSGASAIAIQAEDGSGVFVYLADVAASAAAEVDDEVPDSGLISLGMLREVPLEVSAELGRTRLPVAEILQLNVGSVIELDRTAGAPVDVVVNGSLIARGEVVVIDDEYGVRITEIVGRVADTL